MLRSLCLAIVVLVVCASCKTAAPISVAQDQMAEARNAIRKVIDDPTQQAEMLKVLDSLTVEIDSLMEDMSALRKEMDAAEREYATTEKEFQALYDKSGALILRATELAETHSMEMRGLCSKEEWNKIFN